MIEYIKKKKKVFIMSFPIKMRNIKSSKAGNHKGIPSQSVKEKLAHRCLSGHGTRPGTYQPVLEMEHPKSRSWLFA